MRRIVSTLRGSPQPLTDGWVDSLRSRCDRLGELVEAARGYGGVGTTDACEPADRRLNSAREEAGVREKEEKDVFQEEGGRGHEVVPRRRAQEEEAVHEAEGLAPQAQSQTIALGCFTNKKKQI